MNNIFKVIWNHATQTWTAVEELASAKSKSKSIKLAAISTALLGSVSGVQAAVTTTAGEIIAVSSDATPLSSDDQATVNGKDSVAIGIKSVAGKMAILKEQRR